MDRDRTVSHSFSCGSAVSRHGMYILDDKACDALRAVCRGCDKPHYRLPGRVQTMTDVLEL